MKITDSYIQDTGLTETLTVCGELEVGEEESIFDANKVIEQNNIAKSYIRSISMKRESDTIKISIEYYKVEIQRIEDIDTNMSKILIMLKNMGFPREKVKGIGQYDGKWIVELINKEQKDKKSREALSENIKAVVKEFTGLDVNITMHSK